MYAASSAKFVDYSDALLRFPPPRLETATFTRNPGGWNITLRWTFDNPGRLPMRLVSFQFEFWVDNRSDSREPLDGAKLGTEYTRILSFYLDRYTGPVVPAGGSKSLDWWVDETDPGNAGKITSAMDPTDGSVYIVVADGVLVFYVAEINERHQGFMPPLYRRT